MTISNNQLSQSNSDEGEERLKEFFEGGPKFVKRPIPEENDNNSEAVSSQGYWLPGREDEQLRLTGSHFALKELYGSNIQPEVANYISFEKGVDCLHIYCGAGAFITDMAVEYPNSNFVGVDTTISSNIMFKLPNVTLLPGNVIDGLNFPDSSFDYIQMRITGTILRVSEWSNALKEVYRLLRPGGCVGFFEYEPRENGNEKCKELFRAMIEFMEKLEQDPFSGQHLKGRLLESGFEHIKTETTMIDCGTDTGRSKRWIWVWSELLNIIGPFLCPILDVKLEDWPEYVLAHAHNMEQSHGHITTIRILGRKPLN